MLLRRKEILRRGCEDWRGKTMIDFTIIIDALKPGSNDVLIGTSWVIVPPKPHHGMPCIEST